MIYENKMLIIGETGDIWELSVLTLHIFCKSKTMLDILSLFKKKKNLYTKGKKLIVSEGKDEGNQKYP